MAHHWEEPAISGKNGSGTIFFSGCNLGCCFCQNASISQKGQGTLLSRQQLIEAILKLVKRGVHNINLVTASHYADRIPGLIQLLRQDCSLPVVWNSSAYETVNSLRQLSGCIDIYLPDIKYYDSKLSADLANASDYFEVAGKAIQEMYRQKPQTLLTEEGVMKSGLIIRHLVLPGQWRDSCRILDYLAANLPQDIPLSLMCQYTPQQILPMPERYPELNRRLTTFEYKKVLDHALELGFCNILGQRRNAADSIYTPDFSSLWGADV